MDFDEAVALSEAEDLAFHPPNTLAKVKTSMFMLAFTGKKSELNRVMSNLPPDSHIYWRSNKVGGKDVHRVILKDDTAAMFARMFGEENPVTRLTVGELAEARNVLDIPWLPANRGFLTDRIHDGQVRRARIAVESAQHMSWEDQASDTRKALSELSEKLRAMLRRPRRYEC